MKKDNDLPKIVKHFMVEYPHMIVDTMQLGYYKVYGINGNDYKVSTLDVDKKLGKAYFQVLGKKFDLKVGEIKHIEPDLIFGNLSVNKGPQGIIVDIFLGRKAKYKQEDITEIELVKTKPLPKKPRSETNQFETIDAVFKANFNKNYKKLTDWEKAIHNFCIISGDVGNGGFLQFFQNTKDEFVLSGIQAFNTIGNKEVLKVFADAVQVYKTHRKKFINNEDISDAVIEKLEKLDDKFYNLEKDVEKRIFKHIMANKDKYPMPK